MEVSLALDGLQENQYLEVAIHDVSAQVLQHLRGFLSSLSRFPASQPIGRPKNGAGSSGV